MKGYNPKNKYVVRGKVLGTYDLPRGNLGVLVEDAYQGRRELVEFPCGHSTAPLSLESLFGLNDYYTGKTEHLEQLLKPGTYVDLLSYEGSSPIREAYYLRAVYTCKPRDWYSTGHYNFWCHYGQGYQRGAGHYVPGYSQPMSTYHSGQRARPRRYWP